jgi:hypothetical protein
LKHIDDKTTTTTSMAIIAIVAVLPTTFVYAQTTTTTTPEEGSTTTAPNNATGNTTTSASLQLVSPSAPAQQIINSTKTECEQAQFFQPRCVILVYESPTTVVLSGLVKIFGGSAGSRGLYPNPFLWNAVDAFKAQGYTITDIGMYIVGGNKSEANEFHVIMSK